MKLKESIPSNSVKIIELYNKINSEQLDTRPDFQRKLVWKKQHKFHFIETILKNFPFPEIYIASAEMDIEKLTAKEIVVDGQQRLTTIVDYIKGINDFEKQKKFPPFEKLSGDEKRDFLNYLVTVKDLKDMEPGLIKEIFQRINNTEYSLNAVEKTNAQYGDGEFVIFCKQIVDADYKPTLDDTDIVIDDKTKKEFNNFFLTNNVFSSSDKSRMFDLQYAMLIASTFLEGDYYGRSAKIEEYLKQYNASFEPYKEVLDLLGKSIRTISGLKLNDKSYWYNKANLFTLIIELAKVDTKNINLEKLEASLLDLETKSDVYFSDEDLSNVPISEDEKKYFEMARQGSNEKASRLHRGKVISRLIEYSSNQESLQTPEKKRLEFLDELNINYTIIIPTKTGLEKSVIDAISSLREFLQKNNIHNYDTQLNGSEHKVKLQANFILPDKLQPSEVSLYRANNRGDARIWFSGLNSIAKPNNIIAIILKEGEIYLVNISQLNILDLIKKENIFSDIILK